MAVTRGSLSPTQATTRTSDQIFFGCERSITTFGKFQSEIKAQYFERQKLPHLLSANRELRNQTHFRFSQTLSHILLYSLTHNTILSHKQHYILLQKQLYSHIHYYTLSHTLVFSVTYTTILSHIPNYTLSHTLLYRLTYTSILSHIHYCTLTYPTICSLTYTTIFSNTYM